MPTYRFDDISKLLSQRLSRRTALRGAGAGLAGIGFASTTAFAAQDATPVAEADTVHPNAGGPGVEYLFTQAFESGTWEPKDGEEDVYTLTLSGAPAQTIYFSDRPDRIFGVTPMQLFLDGLGFSPDNPPNAALVTNDPETGDADTLIIELFNPVYDATSATLTYDARVLANYQEDSLSHAAIQQQDYDFPATFERGGLFIDDHGCPDHEYVCERPVMDDKAWHWEPVGLVTVETCLKPQIMRCLKCHDAKDACIDKFSYPCTNIHGDNMCRAQRVND